MEYREFTGKTVDDAIIEAATTLGVASSELDTVVVNKGTSGFLGLGSKPAVIKARPKSDSDDLDNILEDVSEDIKKTAEKSFEETNESEVAEETAPAETAENNDKAVIDDSIVDETRAYLEKLFAAMELEAVIDINLDKPSKTMNIDVEGPEMGIIIGKRGQTLDSLQYLISLYVNKKSETFIRVKLDTENYRERRKETLENLAKNIAFKVKKSRRAFTLEPMNPYERRIIHSTLQNDKYVSTRSEGEEPYRKVVVYPKKNNYKKYN